MMIMMKFPQALYHKYLSAINTDYKNIRCSSEDEDDINNNNYPYYHWFKNYKLNISNIINQNPNKKGSLTKDKKNVRFIFHIIH